MAGRKRELIQPSKGDKRYARRDAKGRFTKDQVDVGASLRKDVQQRAKTTVQAGHGDRGDQRQRG